MNKIDIFYKIVGKNFKNKIINNVVINSKELNKNDLFVAIRGGNQYVNEALEKGALVIYDNENIEILDEEKYKENLFLVKDSIKFLQEFAKEWRKNLKIKVIGITGSNGKTTVKDMVYQLLSTKYKGKKTEGNYNNHIGLPFTLLRSEKDDEFIILEMGMSDFGEIDLLGEISKPDIGIITNIGESHLEFLKTKENVFKAKTELIRHVSDTLIINGNDEFLKRIEKKENKNLIKVIKGNNFLNSVNVEENNFYYDDIKIENMITSFKYAYLNKENGKKEEKVLKTNVLGEHNIGNLTMAIAVAKLFNIEEEIVSEAVKNIVLTNMRFQIIDKGNVIYINDAYNASPISMKKSLETFSQIYNNKVKIAVLGDMLELGENEKEFHEEIASTLNNINVNKVYLYGKRMKFLYDKLLEENIEKNKNIEVEYFIEKDEIKSRINKANKEKVIFIKASRGMKLEEIIE